MGGRMEGWMGSFIYTSTACEELAQRPHYTNGPNAGLEVEMRGWQLQSGVPCCPACCAPRCGCC